MGGAGTEEIVMSDPGRRQYKKLVLKDDKLVGACLYGNTVDGSWYFKLLREGRSVAELRASLMFGESNLGDGGHAGQNQAAAMPDEAEVCGLQRRDQGHHLQDHQGKGLFTIDEVRKHQGQRQLRLVHRPGRADLMATVAAPTPPPAPLPVCSCTEHGHQALRDAIRANHLSSARKKSLPSWSGRRPTAAPAAARPSTTT